MSTPFEVIDLGLVVDGVAPESVLEQIRTAGSCVGVVQVVNHGVPQALIDEHDRRTTALLAQSRADKAALASPTAHPYRGWRQWPDDLGRLELERYSIGRFDDEAEALAAGVDPVAAHRDYGHVNVWPATDPGYRDVAREFLAQMVVLAERMLSLYAQALGVPADSFASVGPDTTRVTFNNYPTWTWPDAATDEDKLLLLEHADGNAVTILNQVGDYAGLQVQQPDGSWAAVPILEGALQVFNGGLMSRWTNDRLVPGRHRVVAGGSETRHSVAVFYGPGERTTVAPLAPFVAEDGEAYYDPITIEEQSQDFIEDYMRVFGRPEQVAAWQSGKPFIAEVREETDAAPARVR